MIVRSRPTKYSTSRGWCIGIFMLFVSFIHLWICMTRVFSSSYRCCNVVFSFFSGVGDFIYYPCCLSANCPAEMMNALAAHPGGAPATARACLSKNLGNADWVRYSVFCKCIETRVSWSTYQSRCADEPGGISPMCADTQTRLYLPELSNPPCSDDC